MFKKINTCTYEGSNTTKVELEVNITKGMPYISIVGMGDKAVKEAIVRVKSAINMSGYTFPMSKIAINLSPSDIRKSGSHFDLPMAIAIILIEQGLLDINLDDWGFFGELSLDGKVKDTKGILTMVMELENQGIKKFLVPKGAEYITNFVRNIEIYAVSTLEEAFDFLIGRKILTPIKKRGLESHGFIDESLDFKDVRGQEVTKRAMVIMAAGRHGAILVGPNGSGKTMVARRLPTIMGNLSFEEKSEVAKVYSISNVRLSSGDYFMNRPFRQVHSSISKTGLIGGGIEPVPGEISLASCGVLFLDEVTNFQSGVLDSLREPMEDGKVVIKRKGRDIIFPANPIVLMACNPCKCGNLYSRDEERPCICTSHERLAYRNKISGAILDRIDIYLTLEKVKYNEISMNRKNSGLSSLEMKKMVEKAVSFQKTRFGEAGLIYNGNMNSRYIKKYCKLGTLEEKFIKDAFDRLRLSARGYFKVLKVARTIADLDERDNIEVEDIMEACQYRNRFEDVQGGL